jgi:hypothetical protein
LQGTFLSLSLQLEQGSSRIGHLGFARLPHAVSPGHRPILCAGGN